MWRISVGEGVWRVRYRHAAVGVAIGREPVRSWLYGMVLSYRTAVMWGNVGHVFLWW